MYIYIYINIYIYIYLYIYIYINGYDVLVCKFTIERRKTKKHLRSFFVKFSHVRGSVFQFSPGSVLYLQNGAGLGRNPNGGWISEMCLWTPWAHVGDLVSANFSRVLAIHVKDRQKTLGLSGDNGYMPRNMVVMGL